jgi:putative oxidoreductase
MTTQRADDPSTIRASRGGLKASAGRAIAWLERLHFDALALLARAGLAGVFWRAGQAKVDGFEVTEFTVMLFRDEYKVPILSPELAAHMAASIEHLAPVLLILGLGTRLSAVALLGMTAVIQIFVFPQSWPEHALWATALLLLIARGGGCLSLDHLIRLRLLGG